MNCTELSMRVAMWEGVGKGLIIAVLLYIMLKIITTLDNHN